MYKNVHVEYKYPYDCPILPHAKGVTDHDSSVQYLTFNKQINFLTNRAHLSHA